MKIQRILSNTITHSLDDLSSVLSDLLITEFITKITESVNSETDTDEVAA